MSRALRLALVAAVLLALCSAGGQVATLCDLKSWVAQGELFSAVVCAATAVYVLAMALPFVPGIEIGLALMLVLGAEGVVLVYLCTQLALALSYLAGRLVPPAALARAFAFLGMERKDVFKSLIEANMKLQLSKLVKSSHQGFKLLSF